MSEFLENVPVSFDNEGNKIIPCSKLKGKYVNWEDRLKAERVNKRKELLHDLNSYQSKIEIKRLARIEYLENLEANAE
jgi:hypothetical protein